MFEHVTMLQTVEHAPWCDRNHAETDGGLSYLVSERYWTQGRQPYTDVTLNSALLSAFRAAASEMGTPLLREHTCEGDAIMRLCAAERLRELERQVNALIEAAAIRTRVE